MARRIDQITPAPNHVLPSRFPSVPLPFSFRSARGASWEISERACRTPCRAEGCQVPAEPQRARLADFVAPFRFPSVPLPLLFRYAGFFASHFLPRTSFCRAPLKGFILMGHIYIYILARTRAYTCTEKREPGEVKLRSDMQSACDTELPDRFFEQL